MHIWQVALDVPEEGIRQLEGVLSRDEIERANRFYFARDRRRFIVARGELRRVLGRYLSAAPAEIRFEYNAFGKPALAADPQEMDLRFNLSHSEELAIIAITQSREVGIDLEFLKAETATTDIAQRFFAPGEIKQLNLASTEQQQALFYRFWTRKEAFIKAIGQGVSFPLDQVDTSEQMGEEWSMVKATEEGWAAQKWMGLDLALPDGFLGALVVEGTGCELIRHE